MNSRPGERRNIGAWVALAATLAACDRPSNSQGNAALARTLGGNTAAITASERTAPQPAPAGNPNAVIAAALGSDSDHDQPPNAPQIVAGGSNWGGGQGWEVLDAPWLAYFPTGSTRHRSRDGRRLFVAAHEIARLHGTVPVTVEGHADSTGDPARNVALAQARAEAVVDALVALGVPRSELRAVGRGSSDPAAPDTPSQRWRNRRVRLVIGG